MSNLRFTLVGLTLACAAGVAQAEIISSDPYALGGNRRYVQSGPSAHFHSSFFDIFIDLDYTMTGQPQIPPPILGSSNIGSSGNDGVAIGLGGGSVWSSSIQGSSSFFDIFTELSLDGTRVYNTEMLSLDLHGSAPWGPFMIRESPTRQSLGRYTIRESPTLPGQYHIDSFFDIFTELSLDGGQTWHEATGPIHMELVPAPGVFGLLALSGVLAGRRRRN